jgi:hypothetical protein
MKHVSVVAGEILPGVCTRFGTRTAIWRTAVWRTAAPALFLALACVFTGCESDEDADADKNGAGDGGAAADSGAARNGAGTDAGGEPAADGITLSWMVRAGEYRSVSNWITAPGLQGVEVCLIESVNIPCVGTDENGVFVLQGVPKNREVLLTFSKEGYYPYLVSVRTGTEDIVRIYATQPVMLDKSHNDEEMDAVGVVADQSKGHIVVAALDPSNVGTIAGPLSVSLDPAAGDGPFFWNTDVHIDPEATRLSPAIVLASFHNLDRGQYVVSWQIENPEQMSCVVQEPIWGLRAEQPNAMRVNVRPGFISGTNIIVCTPAADADADAGV